MDNIKPITENEIRTQVIFFGKSVEIVCDGLCHRAWGNHWPGSKEGNAPLDPGTYEGSDAKPINKVHNRWCARECVRSRMDKL